MLSVRGLDKRYAAPVLADFDFDLAPGEVHVLVGANGAGKSTFVRMLCGLAQPDRGEIRLDGRVLAPVSRAAAERSGVVIVLQELNLLPTLSVAENLQLDQLPHRWGWLNQRALAERGRAALARVGLAALDPATLAGTLGIAEQQLIEIARALDRQCRILILDEPTAALTAPEIERLFEQIQRLRAAGTGIIYITHRMDEIPRIGDRVSVLRDGRRIVTRAAADSPPSRLLADMVGNELPAARTRVAAAAGPVRLRVEELSAGGRVRQVSFAVRAGEVLGIAGLVGSGRTETLRAIFGADRLDGGVVYVGNSSVPLNARSPHDAVCAGVGFVPEDRKRDGLLLSLPIAANAGLASLRAHARHGWVSAGREEARAAAAGRQVDLVCASLAQPVQELSGGNQQKVVLARWLMRDCSVLLVDEPTRGIDLGAKQRIYELLRSLAAAGKAIVVVSSETPELFALCDRLLVMSAGSITAEFTPDTWSEDAVLRAAFSGYAEFSPTAPSP